MAAAGAPPGSNADNIERALARKESINSVERRDTMKEETVEALLAKL